MDGINRRDPKNEKTLEHRLRVLNALLSLSLEDLSLEVKLQRALDEILSIPWLPVKSKGGIFLVEDNPTTLILKVHRNFPLGLQEACARVPLGRCLCGRVASNRLLLHTPCVDEHHETHYAGMVSHGHYNVPILVSEKLFGVIVLYLPEGHAQSRDEEEFLTSVANTLAGLIARAQTCQVLHEREEIFRSLSAAAYDALLLVNHEGRVCVWNEAAERMFGFRAQEALGQELAALVIPAHHRSRHQAGLERFRQTGQGPVTRTVVELEACRKEGTLFPVELAISPVQLRDGWGTVGIVRDITERKRAQWRLEASEARFRAFAETAADWFWELNSDLRFTYVAGHYDNVLGLQHEAILDRTPSEVFFSTGSGCSGVWERHFSRLGGEGAAERTATFELAFERPDSTPRVLRVSGKSFFDANGAFRGYRGVVRDITERKAAEEQTRQHHEEMARVMRAISMGEVAAGLAHELSQPLTAIVSYAEGAVQRYPATELPNELLQTLKEMARLAKGTTHIIRNLRKFLQPSDTEWHPVDINAVVREAALLLASQARKQGAEMLLSLTNGLSPVQGNYTQLVQVLVNLMTNGLEAMDETEPQGRVLKVATRLGEQPGIEVTVVDRGIGLAEETAARMFNAFFTTKQEGLGMGLAICRTILENHGGRLWATPNPERGSTFHMALPTSPAQHVPR